MRVRTMAVLAAALLSGAGGTAGRAADGSTVIEQAYARNDPLRAYTFHMDVAMTMRHFPWLRFHMEGDGVYDRGNRYVVHFTKMPWFAPQAHDIDLSVIDPQMWPGAYDSAVDGQRGDATLFTLHSLRDPSLREAQVAISPTAGTQWVSVTYQDGTHVEMNVLSTLSGDYLLPQKISADVQYPHMPLSAKADFTDYAIP